MTVLDVVGDLASRLMCPLLWWNVACPSGWVPRDCSGLVRSGGRRRVCEDVLQPQALLSPCTWTYWIIVAQMTQRVMSLHERVFFIAHISSWRKKKNRWIRPTGCNSSLTYSATLLLLNRRLREHSTSPQGMEQALGEKGSVTIPEARICPPQMRLSPHSSKMCQQLREKVRATHHLTEQVSPCFQKVHFISKYTKHIGENMQCPVYTIFLKKDKTPAPKYWKNKCSLISKSTINSQYALQ